MDSICPIKYRGEVSCMASYMEISNISRKILELLQGELVPELIPSIEYIGLAGPADRGSLTVGIFLYDIQESTEIKANSLIYRDNNTLNYPPLYLNIYYMITVYAEGDIHFKSLREEMIIGKILRLFHDYSVLQSGEGDIPAKIELIRLTPEEKSRFFSLANVPCRLSVFYKVSPVTIDSARIREITKVTGIDIHMSEKDGREKRGITVKEIGGIL